MQIPSAFLRPNSSSITVIDVFSCLFFATHSFALTKTLLHSIVSSYAHFPFLSSSFELIAACRDKCTFCQDSISELRNLCQYRQHKAQGIHSHKAFTVVELFETKNRELEDVILAITSPVPALS